MRRVRNTATWQWLCLCVALPSCANVLELDAASDDTTTPSESVLSLEAAGSTPTSGLEYTSALTVTAGWKTGYCAVVKVHNETSERLPAWSVGIELSGTKPWGFWGAQTKREGTRLTATPWHHSVLRPGATTLFGFCANRSDPSAVPSIITPAIDMPTHLAVAVYIPRVIDTCFIGDPCEPGSPDCTGLVAPGEVLVEGFTSDSFAAVRTTSPRRQTANKELCLALTMSAADRRSVLAELDAFREFVRTSSKDDIQLDLHIIEYDHLDMDLTRWGGGFWIGPWDFKEFALAKLDFLPDFNIVIAAVGDPVKNLSHWIGACGGAFGADVGIAGGGYSWIPKSTALNYDCGTQPTITHEWLHQVHYAYDEVSGFEDLYGEQLPQCGAGDPNTRRWFPDSHQCANDPDFVNCGAADCGTNDLVNAHILSAHWDPAFAFFANHCKNARQDYDETGVDTGPSCGTPDTMQRAGLAGRGTPLPTP